MSRIHIFQELAKKRWARACGFGAVLAAMSIGSARAQTWTGAVNTNWFTPGNWSPASLPVASGLTVVDNGSTTSPVAITAAGATAYYLSIGSASGSTGALSVSGAGTLTTTDNTNGLVVGDLGNGTLTISGGGAVNSGTVVLANNAGTTGAATVTGAGSSWTANTFYIAADHSTANLTVSAGGALSGQVIDIADFVAGGSGTLTVTGSGSSLASTASLSIGTLGSGALTVENGATARIAGGFGIGSVQGSGAFNVLSGASVTSTTGNAVQIGGASSLGGAATVSGAGSLWTLAGAFNGDALDVSGGSSASTLTIGNGGQVVVSPSTGATGAAGVSIGNAGSGAANMIVDGSGSSFTSPGNLTIGASGAGSLTLSNGGSVALTTSGSTLTLGGSAGSAAALNIGAAPGSAAAPPGTLSVGNVAFAATTSGPLAINFNHTSSNYIFATPISGPGAVNALAGATILTTNQAYTGNTTIASGAVLQLGNGGTTGLVATNIADNGTLIVNRSSSFLYSFNPYTAALSGNGVFSLTGGGTMTMNGDSSGFAGAVNLHNATLNVAADVNGAGKLGGASADIGVGSSENGSISVYNTAPHSGAALAISGQMIIGDAGTGLVGNSSGATISDGSLVLGAQASGNGSAAASGGAWTNTGSVDVGAQGKGYLSIGSGAAFSDSSAIIGDASGASGKAILAGTGAVWNNSGTVTIAAQTGSTGVLDIGAPVGIGALIPGSLTTSGIVFGAGAGTLNFNHTSSNYSFAPAISGSGTVNVLAGATILAADSTYTGATNISSGATLQLGTGGSSGSIASAAQDNGALIFDRSGARTYAGALSGNGVLNFLAGTTHLSGASGSFTGATSVQGGTVYADGALGSATLSVASGATLGGRGSIAGAVSIANSATLLGASGQSLTMGSLALNSNSSVNVALGAASTSPLFAITGNLGLAGALNVSDAGGFGVGVYRLFNYGGTLSNAGLTLSALPGGDNGVVQTSVANQVNLLVSSTTMPTTQFWNGSTTAPTGTVVGGSGTWTGGSTTNWTDAAGAGAYAWGSDFAVFQGARGAAGVASVVVDSSAGAISTAGMQFIGAGWMLSGAPIALNGAGGVTTIRVGDGSAAGAADNVAIAAVLTGSGALSKTDLGTLTLSGVNTYAGGTNLQGGTLGVGNSQALGAGTLTMLNGTTLQFAANGLNLANAITLGAPDPTIDSGTGTDTLSGAISGAGALTKIGSGTLILSNANTYTGATEVQVGTLAVTGSIAASAVQVDSGAILGGSGAVGAITALSGSTVAPGALAPYATLKSTGNVVFNAGSTYFVNISAAGLNDKLTATGAATINGATLQVAAASGTYSSANSYTLLTAQGGVSGSFATTDLSANLAFLTPVLSYGAQDVTLGFTQKAAFASAGVTPNQISTAEAIAALGVGSLYSAVSTQSTAGARAAFDALAGDIHPSAISVAFDDARLPRSAMLDRLTGDVAPDGGGNIWGQAFGATGNIAGDGNAAGLNRALGGFLLGADTTLRDSYRLGVVGGYTQSRLDQPERGAHGNFDSSFAGVYGGAALGALRLRGGALYAIDRTEIDRAVVFPGFIQAVRSANGGATGQGFVEAGWRVPLNGLPGPSFVEPFVGAMAMNIDAAGFTETGGAAALTALPRSYRYGATTLGLRGRAEMFDDAPLSVGGMLGWQHVIGALAPGSAMAFNTARTQRFPIFGAPIARDAMTLQTSLDWRLTQQTTLSLIYSGVVSPSGSDTAINGRLAVKF